MMATPSDSLGQDLRAWAADQLQVAVNALPETVRAAYLRSVEHDNGAPNLHAREALLILTGHTNAARPVLALEGVEDDLQRETDDFAARFFTLAAEERKTTWDRLHARGQGFVRVAARLAALRPGLWVDLPDLDRHTDLGRLAALVCQLFTLRPLARAARRHAFLAGVKREGKWELWARAANRLRAAHGALAALEPEFISQLADVEARVEKTQQLQERMRQVARSAPAPQKKTGWWPIALVVFVVLGALRAFNSGAPSSPPRTIPPLQRPNLQDLGKINPEDIHKGKLPWGPQVRPEEVVGKELGERWLNGEQKGKKALKADTAKGKNELP
jgi:hypothetical protein